MQKIMLFLFILPVLAIGQDFSITDSIKVDVYYNSCYDSDVSNRGVIELKNLSNKTLKVNAIDVLFEHPDESDKTNIFILPSEYEAEDFFIEGKSNYIFRTGISLNNHKESKYEAHMVFKLEDHKGNISIDTTKFTANVFTKSIFTRGELIRVDQQCFPRKDTAKIMWHSVISSCDPELIIEEIQVNKPYEPMIFSVTNPENTNRYTDIYIPYNLEDKILSMLISFDYINGQIDTTIVDYITNKGVFSDTIINFRNNSKGLFGKPFLKYDLTPLNNPISFNDFSILLCTDEDYYLKDYYYEGIIDPNDIIDLKSKYEKDQFLNTDDVVNLFDITVTPKVTEEDRIFTVYYELVNNSNGNIMKLEFPIRVGIAEPSNVEIKNDKFLFPNPAGNIINIDYNGDASYKIFSIRGEVVKEGIVNSKINITELPTGSYYIKIYSKSGELEVKKFIKK